MLHVIMILYACRNCWKTVWIDPPSVSVNGILLKNNFECHKGGLILMHSIFMVGKF